MGQAWKSLPDMLDRESEREVESVKRRLLHLTAAGRSQPTRAADQPAARLPRRHRVA